MFKKVDVPVLQSCYRDTILVTNFGTSFSWIFMDAS
jgi:hypothetical protein